MKENTVSPISKKQTIRDGFSMPKDDHGLLMQIQLNLMSNGIAASKSQILRAALHALIALPAEERLQLLESLSPVKQGRPPKTGS